MTFVAIAVGVFFNSQPAFNVNGPSALQVLRRSLGLAAPESHPKPCSDVVILTSSAVLATLIRREAKTANRRALRRVTQLRIATQIANQSNFIKRHKCSPVFVFLLTGDSDSKELADTNWRAAVRQASA